MFQEVTVEHEGEVLQGHISSGDHVKAWIIFAHGSGSSRKSKRNNWVATQLNQQGFGTLLFDLLTVEEDRVHQNRFNIPMLAERLLAATRWLIKSSFYKGMPIGYFGASTGAAAALMATAEADRHWPIYAIVSRGGRPDLAGTEFLREVFAPTLLIVGSQDGEVIKLNEKAKMELPDSRLVLVQGATHLFEEPGALDEVMRLSGNWFSSHLEKRTSHSQEGAYL